MPLFSMLLRAHIIPSENRSTLLDREGHLVLEGASHPVADIPVRDSLHFLSRSPFPGRFDRDLIGKGTQSSRETLLREGTLCTIRQA